MNPILHDLHSKQWIFKAANAKHKGSNTSLTTGFKNLDKVLSNGLPAAGMIHLQSCLGCGEMRFMLSILQAQHKTTEHKMYVFIDPPFTLNAEFLLAQNISLSQLVVLQTNSIEDALWSAEQCAKSGACCAVFMWQHKLKHIQIRKLEHAAQKGDCYCVWLHNISGSSNIGKQNEDTGAHLSNLPLSLSLSIHRQTDSLSITINKQKIGWAQKAVVISLPFTSRTHHSSKYRPHSVSGVSNVMPIHVNN